MSELLSTSRLPDGTVIEQGRRLAGGYDHNAPPLHWQHYTHSYGGPCPVCGEDD